MIIISSQGPLNNKWSNLWPKVLFCQMIFLHETMRTSFHKYENLTFKYELGITNKFLYSCLISYWVSYDEFCIILETYNLDNDGYNIISRHIFQYRWIILLHKNETLVGGQNAILIYFIFVMTAKHISLNFTYLIILTLKTYLVKYSIT